MNSFTDLNPDWSEVPARGQFEIQQTEDSVTIVSRDPHTKAVRQIVTFSGRDEARAGTFPSRLTAPVPVARW